MSNMSMSGRGPEGLPVKKCFSAGELPCSSFSLGSFTRGPAGAPRRGAYPPGMHPSAAVGVMASRGQRDRGGLGWRAATAALAGLCGWGLWHRMPRWPGRRLTATPCRGRRLVRRADRQRGPVPARAAVWRRRCVPPAAAARGCPGRAAILRARGQPRAAGGRRRGRRRAARRLWAHRRRVGRAGGRARGG